MWDRLSAEQLSTQCDAEAAKRLFKASVSMVEIEVFSYCNRRCWFCPNSIVDRISNNVEMRTDIYDGIIRQLSRIEYDGVISYSRYNEPLADRVILERIAFARELLPAATLHTNTNGDYLDGKYIEDLYDAGLRSLNIQLYLKNDERYDHAAIGRRFEQVKKRIALPCRPTVDKPGTWLEYSMHYRNMRIRVYGRNFEINGTNRGEQVDLFSGYIRTAPCLMPFWSVYIDFDGSMMPCCNLRSDIDQHKMYIQSRLSEESNIFLNYTNMRASSFRRSLINENEKEGLCRSCTFAIPDVQDSHREMMRRLNASQDQG